jgi:hypothetical protein
MPKLSPSRKPKSDVAKRLMVQMVMSAAQQGDEAAVEGMIDTWVRQHVAGKETVVQIIDPPPRLALPAPPRRRQRKALSA